jgi:hypothetical protein
MTELPGAARREHREEPPLGTVGAVRSAEVHGQHAERAAVRAGQADGADRAYPGTDDDGPRFGIEDGAAPLPTAATGAPP